MSNEAMMLTARHLLHSLASITLPIVALLCACLTSSCDDKNTSSIEADYGKLRVRQLLLSDSNGKTVVLVAAEHNPAGGAVVVFRNPSGAVVHTIEIDQKK